MTFSLSVPAAFGRQEASLSPSAFTRIAEFAEKEAGLSIPASKHVMIESRLRKRLKAIGCPTFEAYLSHVENMNNLTERSELIAALTTNVSHFFREQHHFELLKAHFHTAMLPRLRSGGTLRIWSAGCSTGQEPYSIVIALLEIEPRLSEMDFKVLATDIDTPTLEFARSGRFDESQMSAVESSLRKRYFTNAAGCWEVSEQVRRSVAFRPLNLMKPWPMRRSFDVIFCRNVVIYFSEETQLSLWPRFAGALLPQGTLFLGHSERIHRPELYGLTPSGVTGYRKS